MAVIAVHTGGGGVTREAIPHPPVVTGAPRHVRSNLRTGGLPNEEARLLSFTQFLVQLLLLGGPKSSVLN